MNKERWMALGAVLFLIGCIGLVLFDFYLYESNQWTISDYLGHFGLNVAHPIIMFGVGGLFFSGPMFVLGVLAGHWWWPMKTIGPDKEST